MARRSSHLTLAARLTAPRLAVPLLALLLLAAACTSDPGGGEEPGDDPVAGTSSTAAPSPTAPSPTRTPSGTRTLAASSAVVLTPDDPRCTSPEGVSVVHPADWAAVSDCGMFGPAPLAEPEHGTDERPGVVQVYVDRVPFGEVAGETGADTAGVTDRAVTVVDGLQAVRIVRTQTGAGLLPEGARTVQWLVDLSVGVDDPARTLLATTDDVGLGELVLPQAAATLDAMARTLQVGTAPPGSEQVVARLEGGGAPLVVTAVGAASAPGTCLRVVDAPDVAPTCLDLPAGEDLVTGTLATPAGDVVIGVTAPHVRRVEVRGAQDDRVLAVLPVEVVGRDARAFALPLGPDEAGPISTSTVVGPPVG